MSPASDPILRITQTTEMIQGSATQVNDSLDGTESSLPLFEDSEPEALDPLDLSKDEGWEDVESDVEKLSYVSLLDEKTFTDLGSMLEYLQESFEFDLKQLRRDLALDFLETVKLVNYIRLEAAKGNKPPNVSSKALFADEKYLQPVLADDAVLFSLDDIDYRDVDEVGVYDRRVAELEERLMQAACTIEDLRTFNRQHLLDTKEDQTTTELSTTETTGGPADSDKSYFGSYDFRDIHETMLKDKARTDAYRDFIYSNKHCFKNKIILDVGCGTGILSMFSVRAGAKHVYAVDNSMIIDKARENIFKNIFQETITCIRGKIEEVELPVGKVDVIISEWMGYALLYEAMLDSVIVARDRFLQPGGLMVPCDMYLCMAPFSDSSLIMDKVTFWEDVYGFDMTSMQQGIFDDVLLQDLQESTIAVDLRGGSRYDFLHLDLYSARIEDLKFNALPFQVEIEKDMDALDGFVIWFDTIFGREERGEVANELSTGPQANPTHWMQTVLLIDHLKREGAPLKKGQKIVGSVSYKRPTNAQRQLNIEVSWDALSSERGTQSWKLE